MNVLITGGAGFIGSHLAELHLNNGDSVFAVDDLSTGRRSNIEELLDSGDFRFEAADLLDWDGLEEAVAEADRIYHLAAVVGMFRVLDEPVEVMRVNVGGTEVLLEEVVRSGETPEILIASSSSVYGKTHGVVLDEEVELVFTPEAGGLTTYALSKLANELQAIAYHREHGLGISIARLFNTVGPRQAGTYGYVLPRFVSQAVKGEPLTVFGDGTQTRSFCDVRDTAKALELLAGNGDAIGKPINVGNTREIPILDLARLVIERSGSSSDIEFIPYGEAYGESFRTIGQRRPVITRLVEATGFQPQWSLEQTIDDLLERQSAGVSSKGEWV
jgi:UDP-glucose 4-epimerase